MNATHYGRNETIYEKRKNGVSQSSVAKEFGISAQRVHQIYLEQERREMHPYVNELLAKMYPEVNARTISVAVNAMMRYWTRNGYLKRYLDKNEISVEQFIQMLKDTEDFGELEYVRGIGDVGLAFLRKVIHGDSRN